MILLHATAPVYAVGDEHRLEAPDRALVEAISAGTIRADTTVEAPLLGHRFAALLAPLIATEASDLDAGLEIFRATRLGALDSVFAAVAISRGVEGLVSGDAAFREVPGLRVFPLEGPDLAGPAKRRGIERA